MQNPAGGSLFKHLKALQYAISKLKSEDKVEIEHAQSLREVMLPIARKYYGRKAVFDAENLKEGQLCTDDMITAVALGRSGFRFE